MVQYKIYLAGPISGLTFDGCTGWREYVAKEFQQLNEANPRKRLIAASPMRAKEYLKKVGVIEQGNHVHGMLSGGPAITCRDHYDCLTCDILFVNLLGATRVSIGTMFEIAWAHAYKKPIVLVMESPMKGNIHEHDMLTQMAAFRCDDIDDAIHIVDAIAV